MRGQESGVESRHNILNYNRRTYFNQILFLRPPTTISVYQLFGLVAVRGHPICINIRGCSR